MKINNKLGILPLAVSVALASSASAVTVSYVFSSQASPTTTSAVGDGSGVIGSAGDTWGGLGSGAISGNAVATTTLNDVTGAATSYTIAANGVGAHGGTTANDQPAAIVPFVNSWFRRDAFADPTTFTFGGFNAGDTVDVVFFVNHHNGALNLARGGAVTVGASTQDTAGALGAQTTTTLGTNYAQFNGLVVDGSGVITVDVASQTATGNEFVDLNGFQLDITPIPEPSVALLGGLGILGLLRRRR